MKQIEPSIKIFLEKAEFPNRIIFLITFLIKVQDQVMVVFRIINYCQIRIFTLLADDIVDKQLIIAKNVKLCVESVSKKHYCDYHSNQPIILNLFMKSILTTKYPYRFLYYFAKIEYEMFQKYSISHDGSAKTSSRTANQIEDDSRIFFTASGIRKRRIYYNVEFTEEEQRWIRQLKSALRTQNNIVFQEDQVYLRYFYAQNLNFQACLEKLVKYHAWFSNSEIQTVSQEAKQIMQQGFIYSCGQFKSSKPFIIMNLSKINLSKYKLINYYQALNHVNNKVIREKFIPGTIQTYEYVLDLNEELLTLPLGSLGDIIGTISTVYSMRMQGMKAINCTFATKFLYNRVCSFIGQETQQKIKLFSKSQIQQGALIDFIDQKMLQKRYGGIRQNIDFSKHYQLQNGSDKIKELDFDYGNETQYFSIEQNESYFNQNSNICCVSHQQCIIF